MKDLVIHRQQLPQSGIREIFERAFGIPDVIHLEMGEPDFETPEFIKKHAIESIERGFTHYTPSAGIQSLKDAIANHLRTYQLDVEASQVTVTPGAVTALSLALLALVESGEEVLLPNPGWIYSNMVISQSAIPVYYPLRMENDFLPDFSEMEKLVTEKTKAIVINTPGNPTGAVFTEQKIQELLDFASRHDLYVISDEVYDGIVFDGRHVSPKNFDTEDRVISVYSFSKNYAMTGWRVGYTVAPQGVAGLISKLQEPLVACPSSISQKAAEAAITGPQEIVQEMAEVYKHRKKLVEELLTQEEISFFNPKGAFYVMIDVSVTGLSGRDFALALLDSERVAIAPGCAFGTLSEQMIRISLASDETELIEGVRRICKAIKLKKGGLIIGQ